MTSLIYYVNNHKMINTIINQTGMTYTEQQKRGGRRAGAGRKPTSNVSVTVRIAPRHRRLVRLAGSNLIEKALDLALNEGMSFDIDSRKLTLKERDQFLDGIKKVAK